MKKKIIGITVVLLSIFLVATLIGTFATDSTVATADDTHTITLRGSTGEITVPAGTSKTALYQITNTNKGVVKYAVAYSGDSIVVKVYNDTIDPETGTIDYGENKFIKLYIENSGDTESTVSIKAVLGYEGGGDLDSIKPSGYTLVTEVYTPPKSINLITHINNLYTSATKTTATNNSITYNYASEIGMMNDRLGDANVDADSGNIRYYGADPNNYIYYNCENYDNPTEETCELWRIIGVFKDIEVIEDGTTVTKDMVKIARASTIGIYAWDNKSSGLGTNTSTSNYGSNDWTDARLMMLLNPGYDVDITDSSGNLLNEHGRSYYWNSGSGTCYAGQNNATTTCDFTSTGLKNDETRNMIAKVVWSLLGHSSSSVYANQIYAYERTTGSIYDESTRAKEWEGYVALMYPSDYGYATDFTQCSSNLYNYETSGCYDNDWLYQTSTYQWLLTPRSSSTRTAWLVISSGSVYYTYYVSSAYGVRPVLYLDSEIDIEPGNVGTSSDPYRISVS